MAWAKRAIRVRAAVGTVPRKCLDSSVRPDRGSLQLAIDLACLARLAC